MLNRMPVKRCGIYRKFQYVATSSSFAYLTRFRSVQQKSVMVVAAHNSQPRSVTIVYIILLMYFY